MRLIFVHWVYEDRGSAQDLYHYREVAKQLGHEVVIYGPPEASSFHYSLEINDSDAVVFICEWTTQLQYGDQLDLLRLVAKVPRRRRVVRSARDRATISTSSSARCGGWRAGGEFLSISVS